MQSIELKLHHYKIVIAIFAFFIYTIYNFFYLSLGPIFPDESRFISEAIHFAQYGEFRTGNDKAWEMPLTGILYGIIYFFTGNESLLIAVIRFLQSLLLIINAYLIFGLSKIIFKNDKVAFLGFIGVLFYPFFIYYQALLLSETVFITLLIASFYFFYKWAGENFAINRSFYFGVFFGSLSIYSKGTMFFLIPILPSVIILSYTFDLKRSFKAGIYTILLYILFLSPWWIRNYTVFDTFIPLTTSSGSNLYLGNNPSNLYGGCDWSKDVDLSVVKRINQIPDEIDRNKAMVNEAIRFINQNPNRFLELAWLKFKRYYNIVPNAESFSYGAYRWISICSFGPIAFLSILTIFLARKQFRMLAPLYLLFIYFTFMHIFIIASLRYRLPLEPFMILLAGYGAIQIFEFIKGKIKKYWCFLIRFYR